MTNFEKYKNKILEVLAQTTEHVPGIINGKLVPCESLRCSECELEGDGNNICSHEFVKWLYEDDGEEQGGCIGCKYEYKREDESPCTECCNNYTSKWERRAKKTRQDEFLELFPEARRKNSVLEVCPRVLNVHFDCKINDLSQSCAICCLDYWLQEVE